MRKKLFEIQNFREKKCSRRFLGQIEGSQTFPAGSGEEILSRIRIRNEKYPFLVSRGEKLRKTSFS